MSMFTSINFENVVSSLYEGLYVVDRERRIRYWNKAAEKITGFTAEEVIGSSCSDNILVHIDAEGNSLCEGMCPLAATMEDGRTRQAEVFLHHKSGHRLPVLVRTTPLKNTNAEIIGSVELFSDNSAWQAMQKEVARLRQLSLIDSLTELPNRRYLESQIESALSLMSRLKRPFGILFMDIDHFKRFNDNLGHQIGDLALKTVADTFRYAVRPSDIIGRWGGEEFLGIFPDMDGKSLHHTAERLRILVEHSQVEPLNEILRVTLSVGGVIASPEDDMESLIDKADTAMYTSKEQGRNRVTIHDDDGL